MNSQASSKTVEEIIFECVDYALSLAGFVDKDRFYRLLETSYGLKPESIGSDYGKFHLALVAELAGKHISVERLILRVLKERTKEGLYRPSKEIEAFNIITDVIIKDTHKTVRKHDNYSHLKKYAESLKEKVRGQDCQLHEASRLATIGQTAAMVGHDIRNPLQAITSDLYLIQEELKSLRGDKSGIEESIGSIMENMGYINKIVSDLQDYARPLCPEYREIDICEVFLEPFSAICVPEEIKLRVEVNLNSKVKTDPVLLRRALTNLVTNAIQAMPRGGELTIKAFKRQDRLWILVQDSGEGLPEESKEKLFSPLFTTKSKGQGLGLAVAKRLVDALGGRISFESQIGKGSTFSIELPLSAPGTTKG